MLASLVLEFCRACGTANTRARSARPRLVHPLDYPLLLRHLNLLRVQGRLGSRLLALVSRVHRAALSHNGEGDNGSGEDAKEQEGVGRFDGGHGCFFFPESLVSEVGWRGGRPG